MTKDIEQRPPLPEICETPTSLVYFGTPVFAVPQLRALHEAGFEIRLVITKSDKRRGRRGEPEASPVKAAAVELGLPVAHDFDAALETQADLGVVVAYGQILRPHLVSQFPMINVHYSLLPRWRGAAPVQRAVLEGDGETGVCLMRVDYGLDVGDVFRTKRVAIGRDETAFQLTTRLSELSSTMLCEALTEGLGQPTPQEGVPTYAQMITSADLQLDYFKGAQYCVRQTRVGRTWTMVGENRLLIHSAELVSLSADGRPVGTIDEDGVIKSADGGLKLLVVQPESKPKMSMADWMRGHGGPWFAR